ncbi:unnamed protein product [Arctia plantaginis]|uniref:Thiamine pyrophosphokinase 1 n=1 Tax=Arctia plantaginis TaxID=874455 RepID=A0A8S0ZXS0_ARCPL|nr:unnamed protein product [Arctia plantaginis]
MSSNGHIDNKDTSCEAFCAVNCYRWNIPQVIIENSKTANYAVLILNRPISQNLDFVTKMWKNASVTITVDGGTRQWEQFLKNQTEAVRKTFMKPDLVTGDFDSIGDEVLALYTKKGCKMIVTPDQNHTDFTKALMELNIHCNGNGIQIDHVIAFAQGSGRLDQTIGNIQSLFLARDKLLLDPHTKVFILSDDSLSWLLNPGEHTIIVPKSTLKYKRAWCSLIPIGEPCKYVTSTGLKWNLDNQPLQFGQLVSTSNAFSGSETVTIHCSHTLLWSMKIPGITKS